VLLQNVKREEDAVDDARAVEDVLFDGVGLITVLHEIHDLREVRSFGVCGLVGRFRAFALLLPLGCPLRFHSWAAHQLKKTMHLVRRAFDRDLCTVR
jgi:hypothetical protein